MIDQLKPYLITAYSEWEALDVEAACFDDDHAKEKGRRYGSLKHISANFPAVIFSHVVAVETDGQREVGTWEFRLKGSGKPILIWHKGRWAARPDPTNRESIRYWNATT